MPGWFRVASFAGGALAGIIASRAMPPLLAQASGMAKAAAGRDPFDVLVEDHRTILALLDQMEQASDSAHFGRAQALFRLKRRLAAHALAEEDVVYPLLHDQMQETEDTKHLYAEHAEMKIHLHALEEMPKDSALWPARVRALKTLIESHIRQEEEVDFPKLRDGLDDQARAKLFGRMQREKALLL